MDDMKTQNGLRIRRAEAVDGRFRVDLFRLDGKLFGSIFHWERKDEWQWIQKFTSDLTKAIDWADQDFVDQEEDRKEKRAAFEPDWQAVIDKYGGADTTNPR